MVNSSVSTEPGWRTEPAGSLPGALDSLRERLRPALWGLRERVTRPGRPFAVRLHVPVPVVDPWTYLAACPNPVQMAWQEAHGELAFAAWGVAAEVSLAGDDRFAAARNFCSNYREQLLEVDLHPDTPGVGDLPMVIGGFAFNSDAPLGVWRDWPAGWLVAPRVLVYRRGARSGALLTCTLQGADHLDEAAAHLAQSWHGLRDLAAAPVSLIPAATATGGAPLEHRDTWCARVETAARAVAAGQLDKVVLARSVEIAGDAAGDPRPTLDAPATLRRLRQRHPAATLFAIRRRGAGTFLGATPECLVRVAGDAVQTVALAGTAAVSGDPARDRLAGWALAQSAKEAAEHRAVVDAIRAGLAPLCHTLEVAPTPQLRRLVDVQHLETPITGRLREPGRILSLVERLHPTPAVGGAPREAALAWLRRHESLERGWYAGPVGWVSQEGAGSFAVALRSGLVRDDAAYAFAGAGIVGASEPASEWRETELKLRPMLEALGAWRQGEGRGQGE